MGFFYMNLFGSSRRMEEGMESRRKLVYIVTSAEI